MSDTSSWSSSNDTALTALLAQAAPPSASGALAAGSDAAAPAQPGTVATPGTTPTGGPPPSGGSPLFMLLPLVLIMVLLMVMSGGAQRREKKRLAALIAALKKNDRVLTIGGIIGTVYEVRDDEVVLKVDENSNTRVRFTKNAIQQVLKPAEGPANTAVDQQPQIEVRTGKERVNA
jgi:preprotein translocase subunit YajC